MPRYKIEGGQPLEGTITISGAKNAAVAIIPATLLVQGCCRIENVPDISDVHILLDILKQMGASVCQRSHDTVEIDCTNVGDMEPDPTLVRSIRASYYLIGAQLGRFGRSRVALPGGCNFAPRPIDQHVKGFLALGAEVEETDAYVDARAREEGLQGGRVNLDVVSVGATINIIIASVLVPGQTVIENAAKEPHIVDLANFLNTMGAPLQIIRRPDRLSANGHQQRQGQTEEQTSCHTFSSGAGPPEGIHRHCGHLGLLNHGKLGSANDEGSHLRIILNHCI